MPRFSHELLIAVALTAGLAACVPAARTPVTEPVAEQEAVPPAEVAAEQPVAESAAADTSPAAEPTAEATAAEPAEDAAEAEVAAADEAMPAAPATPAVAREDVIWIQERLRQMGYYEGAVDGSVGSATRSAVREYQQDQNIPVTGSPSSELRDYIYRNGG